MRYLKFLFILLCLAGYADCQSDYGTPEAIIESLKSSDRKAQLETARWLGLKDPQQDFRECAAHVENAILDEQGDTAVLQVKCGYDLNIVVLRRHGPLSEKLDSQYIYAAYDRSTITFANIIRPSVQEIVVHNAATVSGNLYQAHFLVFRLLHGKLRVVFSSLETGTEPHYGGVPRNQNSTFTITPASTTESGEIVQNSTVEIGTNSFIVRRYFDWSEDWQLFSEGGVATIRVRR